MPTVSSCEDGGLGTCMVLFWDFFFSFSLHPEEMILLLAKMKNKNKS